jgi:mannose-6-phosphate isomerase
MKAGVRDGDPVSAPDPVHAAATRLKRWFFEQALPIWWERGADLRAGGFFDRLDMDGHPSAAPKRLRVQARQAHVYALAGRMGWDGPAGAAGRHGLDIVLAQRQDDELYRIAVATPPAALDGMGLLYDQAFVLLAMAAGQSQLGVATEAAARRLERRLADFAHLCGGYAEAPDARRALFSNPNMHLFEAFQAWSAISPDARWRELTAELAQLALRRLIDPQTGALGERFGPDWSKPADRGDRMIWPGHLYEWAWLLTDWKDGGPASLAAALRLIEVAERAGVDEAGVVIFALDENLSPIDRGARLWSQTERLRACARAATLTGSTALWRATLEAGSALETFLEVPRQGLWRDWRDESGAFREEAAPASSLYHIAGAIAELDRVCRA